MSTATTPSTGTTDHADTVHFSELRRRQYPTLVINAGVLILLTAFLVLSTWSWGPYFQGEIARIVAGLGVAAGLTVLIGLNGQFSLGHGALMAVGGYTVALVQKQLADVPSLYGWRILIALAAGTVTATIAGFIVGIVAARLRGPYLAGVTLALALIVPAVGAMWKTLKSDQGVSIALDPRPIIIQNMHIGNAFVGPDQWRAWIGIAVTLPVLLMLANLIHSRVGRNWRAVRDDEVAAQLSGINIARTQVVCFVVSSVAAGASGGLVAIVSRGANPGTFGIQLSLYLLLGIVIGGIGSLWGALWGSILVVALPDYLTFVSGDLTNGNTAAMDRLNGNLALILFGVALIVVILFASGGIQGFINRAINWARRPFQQRASG
jgi:ABC-type branched-subunit amino acid transport system permease subunit